MLSVAGSGHRLVVWSPDRDTDQIDSIATWLTENAPDVSYSVAELANPAREHGEPVGVIAIDVGTEGELEMIKTRFAVGDGWEFSDHSTRLHLATR